MSQSQARPARRGRITWWASAAVLFIVAVMAVLIFLNPAEKPQPAVGPGPAAGTPAAGCEVPAGDTSAKPAMPADLRWAAARGWTWPVSDTYGPTRAQDGYGTCFARSPLGAALAMATFYGSGNTLDPLKATELYVMDSPGKDAAVRRAVNGTDTAGVGPISFAGFITDYFDGDEAQITMVFSLPDSPTGFGGLPSTLRWVDGDWKIKVLDDGSGSAGKGTTPAAGSFVGWGGRNG